MQCLGQGMRSHEGQQEVLWEPSTGGQVPGAERAEGARGGLVGEAGAVGGGVQGSPPPTQEPPLAPCSRPHSALCWKGLPVGPGGHSAVPVGASWGCQHK